MGMRAFRARRGLPVSFYLFLAFTAPAAAFPDQAGSAADLLRASRPKEQGLNEAVLERGLAALDSSSAIRSFLILRHDAVVVERYYNDGRREDRREVASVTKSVISALAGIALQRGLMRDVDQKLSDLLPEYYRGLEDPLKGSIRLEDLLTMSAGLEPCPFDTDDWVGETLAMPMSTLPGSYFWYNSGLSHIVAVLISRASGMSVNDFAQRTLFGPLGIPRGQWNSDPQGYTNGGGGLFLTPREMAVFGLLYLHRGRWNGAQLIPAEWVEASLQPRLRVPRASEFDTDVGWWLSREITGYDANFAYGYYWWVVRIKGTTVYSAVGYGGQRIHVIPELDTVVVTTSSPEPSDEIADTFGFLERTLIPAVLW